MTNTRGFELFQNEFRQKISSNLYVILYLTPTFEYHFVLHILHIAFKMIERRKKSQKITTFSTFVQLFDQMFSQNIFIDFKRQSNPLKLCFCSTKFENLNFSKKVTEYWCSVGFFAMFNFNF